MNTDEKPDKIPTDSYLWQHYKNLKIEPLEYIEANNLGFHEGNIVKYVSRWRYKGGIDDLKKAKSYIERLIKLAEQETQHNGHE